MKAKEIVVDEDKLQDLFIKFYHEHYLSATVAANRYGVSISKLNSVLNKKSKLVDAMINDMGLKVKECKTVYVLNNITEKSIDRHIKVDVKNRNGK